MHAPINAPVRYRGRHWFEAGCFHRLANAAWRDIWREKNVKGVTGIVCKPCSYFLPGDFDESHMLRKDAHYDTSQQVLRSLVVFVGHCRQKVFAHWYSFRTGTHTLCASKYIHKLNRADYMQQTFATWGLCFVYLTAFSNMFLKVLVQIFLFFEFCGIFFHISWCFVLQWVQ